MKSTFSMVITLAVAFLTLSVGSSAKGVQTTGQRFPTLVQKDGPGPMCFPSTGCGYRDGMFANGEDFPPAVLLTDGPGPMCFPHTGCGYRNGVLASGTNFPVRVLLADSPGPMCFPSAGCGYKDAAVKYVR